MPFIWQFLLQLDIGLKIVRNLTINEYTKTQISLEKPDTLNMSSDIKDTLCRHCRNNKYIFRSNTLIIKDLYST